jgi:hypothetical protein
VTPAIVGARLQLIERLHLSPAAFSAHMALPGLLAAVLCAGLVAARARMGLAGGYRCRAPAPGRSPAPSAGRRPASPSPG